MRVLTLSEFNEFLTAQPVKALPKFTVVPGHIMTGDHHITVFIKKENGVNALIQHTYSKPLEFITITDQSLNALIDARLPAAQWETDYLLAISFKFTSVEAFSAAHDDLMREPLERFLSLMSNVIPTAEITVISDDLQPDRIERAALESTLSKPQYINLSFISFVWNNETHMVIGKGFKEEVVLDLVRFDPEKRHAFFSGIVAGKPTYQRVVLDEVMFKGDREFLNRLTKGKGAAGNTLWWVRHMGVSLHDSSNSITLKNPHISLRCQADLNKIAKEYDFVNNRNVIL